MVMNGQYTENIKMDPLKLILFVTLLILLLTLGFFYQLLKKLIRKQVDIQLKAMIPFPAIRKRIGISISFRKRK